MLDGTPSEARTGLLQPIPCSWGVQPGTGASTTDIEDEALVAALATALRAMLARLSRSSLFRALLGESTVLVVDAYGDSQGVHLLTFEGKAGNFICTLTSNAAGGPATLGLTAYRSLALRGQMDLGPSVGRGRWITGSMADMDGFMSAVEGFVADFLADVAMTRAGGGWIEDARMARRARQEGLASEAAAPTSPLHGWLAAWRTRHPRS